MDQWITGGSLALVVGVGGDICLATYFQTWRHSGSPDWKTLATAIGAMAAILGLLLGTEASTGWFLKDVDFRPFLEPYVAVLALVITPVGTFVLLKVLFAVPRA